MKRMGWMGAALVWLALLAGCAGYVVGGGPVFFSSWVAAPVAAFGYWGGRGGYGGREEAYYGQRGAASRGGAVGSAPVQHGGGGTVGFGRK